MRGFRTRLLSAGSFSEAFLRAGPSAVVLEGAQLPVAGEVDVGGHPFCQRGHIHLAHAVVECRNRMGVANTGILLPVSQGISKVAERRLVFERVAVHILQRQRARSSILGSKLSLAY